MATLREESIWTSPIYRIERHDPLMGGEYGINNVQARQLANRTRYLLDAILKEHKADGSHALTEKNIADAAKIAESKLKLNASTQELYDNITDQQAILANIVSTIDSVQNIEKSRFKDIYQALMFSWKYGYPKFQFDMFTKNFSFNPEFIPVKIIETIAGDDSMDVVDSSTLVPGETYVIWDEKTKKSTPVTIKKILTRQRVIFTSDLTVTRDQTGVLTKCPWLTNYGSAEAYAGSSYITKKLTLLKDYDSGNLVIAHFTPSHFTVSYNRKFNGEESVWNPIPLIKSEYSEKIGMYRSVFETPGGEFNLKITCDTTTTVSHLALMSNIAEAMNTTVRTPEIADSDFTIVRFGALYDAEHVSTTFMLSDNLDFTDNCTEIKFGPNRDVEPIWDYEFQMKSKYPMQPGEYVYWRARYEASDGYKSRWSNVGCYVQD